MIKKKENLPLDTRLLSDAIIELNISRHNVAIYPRSHPIVEKSLNLAFGYLQKLFELRKEITLAVANDMLIIDDYRWFVQRNMLFILNECCSRDDVKWVRPYRGSVEINNIIEMLKKGSGKDFNPFLVDHFAEMLQISCAGSKVTEKKTEQLK